MDINFELLYAAKLLYASGKITFLCWSIMTT